MKIIQLNFFLFFFECFGPTIKTEKLQLWTNKDSGLWIARNESFLRSGLVIYWKVCLNPVCLLLNGLCLALFFTFPWCLLRIVIHKSIRNYSDWRSIVNYFTHIFILHLVPNIYILLNFQLSNLMKYKSHLASRQKRDLWFILQGVGVPGGLRVTTPCPCPAPDQSQRPGYSSSVT